LGYVELSNDGEKFDEEEWKLMGKWRRLIEGWSSVFSGGKGKPYQYPAKTLQIVFNILKTSPTRFEPF
jgi:hypothetical protein